MVRSARRHKIKNWAKSVHFKTSIWAARVLETFTVVVSLLWALEAYAQRPNKKEIPNRAPASQKVPQRAPASADDSILPLPRMLRTGDDANSTDLDHLLKDRNSMIAPESVSTGRHLSDSFKTNPYFVAPAAELLRFPNPKN